MRYKVTITDEAGMESTGGRFYTRKEAVDFIERTLAPNDEVKQITGNKWEATWENFDGEIITMTAEIETVIKAS